MEITAKRPWLSSMGEVPATLDYFQGSMVQAVEKVAAQYPNNVAFDFMGKSTTYKEMVANIINYAYPQPTDDTIELRAESDGKEIVLTLADRGVAFDPTKRGNLNTDINPAEREIGGMGIFIVKNIMNRVTYQRQDGRNLVTMVKEVKR